MIGYLSAVLLILLTAVSATAQPTFTRGQWTQWGSGTYEGAVWTANGTTDKDYSGTTITAGVSLGAWLGLTGNPSNTFIGWSQGGVWDTTHNQFIACCGGGHQGWVNFDVNVFDIASGTWNPSGRPARSYSEMGTFVSQNIGSTFCMDAHLDACGMFIDLNNHYTDLTDVNSATGTRLLPNSGHHSGAMHWMPSVGRMFYGGYYAPHWSISGGGTAVGVVEWDPTTKKYSADVTGSDVYPDPGFGPPVCSAWDSKRNRSLALVGDTTALLWTYNPAASLGSRVGRITTPHVMPVTSYPQCVYDSKRDQFRVYGAFTGTGQFGIFDFTTGATTPTFTSFTVSGTFPIVGAAGILYDPIGDRDVMWVGGQTLYYVDPVTHASTVVAGTGGADPGTVDPGAVVFSVWNRFAYIPTYDVYAIITKYNSAGMYGFAPTRPPVLAFTDIVQGPKSGNVDTSQGQTANVNGAIVTVWGYNLIGATFTINGAAPAATYYQGTATPPNCGAANLYNGYQKLQCAILQVKSTASTGTGTIVAVAGGYTSNTLPFTVKTGNIYFAGVGGVCNGFTAQYSNAQTMLDAVDRDDIGYICGGLTLTSGLTFPANTNYAHGSLANPWMVVAYPGIAVQVGNSTHSGFSNAGSGDGFGVVVAKMTVYAEQNAYGIYMGDNSRVIGNKVTAPLLNSSSGAAGVGGFGNDLFIDGNEMTAVGDPTAGNTLDHVIYLAGRRDLGSATYPESRRDVGWNYIHDNAAPRGINLYNGNPGGSNPITDHKVHDNVIVNQAWSGIGLLYGVSGENWAWNNLCINCGIDNAAAGAGQQVGIQIHAGCDGSTNGDACGSLTNLIHVWHNTFLNSGTSGYTDKGVWQFVTSATIDAQSNLVDQAGNSVAYISPDTVAFSGGGTKNLWYGDGSVPSWDAAPVSANPQLVSVVSTYDLHLQGNSPAIQAGSNMPAWAPYDFDGLLRPSGAAADIGAYQYSGTTASSSPSTGANTLTGAGSITGKVPYNDYCYLY